jgi:hypothetical protein
MGKRMTVVVVVVDEWPADSPHPLGHYADIVGTTGDLLTESQLDIFIALGYNPQPSFAQASKQRWSIACHSFKSVGLRFARNHIICSGIR